MSNYSFNTSGLFEEEIRTPLQSMGVEIKLVDNLYGKSSVKVMKLDRKVSPHKVLDLELEIILKGDMEAAYKSGDNAHVVPTDTMKNTVYIMAKRHSFHNIEEFGKILTNHFLTTYSHINHAEIEIEQNIWNSIKTAEGKHPSSFIGCQKEARYCRVEHSRFGSPIVYSGIKGLTILKSSHSGFENYVNDEYTTLKPTNDRIFATTLGAIWSYQGNIENYEIVYSNVRESLLESFATHDSKSVQHTLFAMAKHVLEKHSELQKIRLLMPNEHKILANLSPFNLENDNEIFVPTPEPFGVIEAEVGRE